MPLPNLAILETVLLDLAESSIRAFAAEHNRESFYAFGIDCNAEYGDVLLCLNTEADFLRASQEYIAKYDYGPDDLAGLRRNFGDWQYQGFNVEQSNWDAVWGPHQKAVDDYVFSDDTTDEEHEIFIEGFLRMVCRVLVQIERSGVLDSIQRDGGFFTHVMDHDEGEDEAIARLEDVRSLMEA